jgi:hypothetical protein
MTERGFVVSNSSPLIALDREVFADSDPPAWLRIIAPAVKLDYAG